MPQNSSLQSTVSVIKSINHTCGFSWWFATSSEAGSLDESFGFNVMSNFIIESVGADPWASFCKYYGPSLASCCRYKGVEGVNYKDCS